MTAPSACRLSPLLLAATLGLLGASRFANAKEPAPKAQGMDVAVTADGLVPSALTVKKGVPLELHVTRKTDDTCAKELVVPDYDIRVALPLNKAVTIKFTPQKSGALNYGCAMGMMVSGVINVE